MKIVNLNKRMEVLAPYNTQQNNPNHTGDLLHHVSKMISSINFISDHIHNITAFCEAVVLHDIGKKSVKSQKNDKDVFYGHPKAGIEIIKNRRKELGLDQLLDYDFNYLVELVLLHDTKYSKMSKINNMVDTYPEGFSTDLLCLQILDIIGQSDLNRSEKLEEIKSFASKILKAENITAEETENINNIIDLIDDVVNHISKGGDIYEYINLQL